MPHAEAEKGGAISCPALLARTPSCSSGMQSLYRKGIFPFSSGPQLPVGPALDAQAFTLQNRPLPETAGGSPYYSGFWPGAQGGCRPGPAGRQGAQRGKSVSGKGGPAYPAVRRKGRFLSSGGLQPFEAAMLPRRPSTSVLMRFCSRGSSIK